jgi:uncharacterized integral membrane protein
MNLRSILVIVVIGVLFLFAAVNWNTFNTPTSLSLVVTNIEAPLGLVMLGFTGVLIAVLLGFALQVHVNALSDSRRQASELRKQRELADQAEASRFTDLRKFVELEFGSLRQAQLDTVERLRDELAAATNALSACIGEIDERLERQWPTPLGQRP